ncbi:hypothetical protein SANA_21650 [Gottschalkiaceae bacterium SANA]|nr:hypothetical protein SANA_21650 [Gottschalkiaceae bacterium SANA]
MKYEESGFTIIELIVVLAILGIILAIAIPNYLGYQARAEAKAAVASLELIEDAIILHKIDTGSWPHSKQINQDPGLVTNIHSLSNWNGSYLNEWAPPLESITQFSFIDYTKNAIPLFENFKARLFSSNEVSDNVKLLVMAHVSNEMILQAEQTIDGNLASATGDDTFGLTGKIRYKLYPNNKNLLALVISFE